MSPKRPPTDDMTLQELGITDSDCAFDPDDLLEGPTFDEDDELADIETPDGGNDEIINAELRKSF